MLHSYVPGDAAAARRRRFVCRAFILSLAGDCRRLSSRLLLLVRGTRPSPTLSRDAVVLGLPDRKLVYAGVAYIPMHAGALAYPFRHAAAAGAAGFGCGAGEEGGWRPLILRMPRRGRAASEAWRRTSTSCSRRLQIRMLAGMAAARQAEAAAAAGARAVSELRSCRGLCAEAARASMRSIATAKSNRGKESAPGIDAPTGVGTNEGALARARRYR